MPQIEQLDATFVSQIFWLLLTFGLVFFVVGRGMASKVQATVDGRDKAVADDLAEAEAARAAADAAEEKWLAHENAARDAAKRRLGDARAAGASASEQRLAAANAELDGRVGEAEARIAAASAAAMDEIAEVAADAARDIVQRVAGAHVDEADARRAVERTLHG